MPAAEAFAKLTEIWLVVMKVAVVNTMTRSTNMTSTRGMTLI